MLRIFSALLAAIVLSNMTASAGIIRGAYVGCLTKQALDEFIGAAVKKDERHMAALMNRQCFAIEGREFSVVKAGFIKSQIRVYAGGDSVLLWVPSEAAR
tara:strand:+ start:5713 stop:6012 length:300 start_codon:yes stop_codon:yes gene_type:complete